MLCQSRLNDGKSKPSEKAAWQKHCDFLLSPRTYLKMHMYADLLSIFKVHSEQAQRDSAISAAAVDVPQCIQTLKAQLQGYAVTKATPRQVGDEASGPTQTNSVLQRCFVDGIIESGNFAVQRGLTRIGFTTTAELSKLSIPLSSTKEKKLGLTTDDFKESYLWATKFAKGLIKSFDKRYPEHTIWHALKELLGIPPPY